MQHVPGPRIRIYLDDTPDPVPDQRPPTEIALNTQSLAAGVHGSVRFMVNAFGAEEPFEPHRAESPSPIPVWVWVLSLLIVAWTAWYVATVWNVPADYAKTPTNS